MKAGLVFGVGAVDERFQERGLSRLVHHLSTLQIHRSTVPSGEVDATHTTFQFSGPRGDVQQCFRTLLRTLNNLPHHALDEHAQALVKESLRREERATFEALSIMYGFGGPGIMALPATGLLRPRAEALEEWRRRYFVKENAAAFFVGPRPEDFSFSDLPSGERPAKAEARRILDPTPSSYRSNCSGPTLFAPIAAGRVASLVLDIASQRLTQRLQEEMGIDGNVTIGFTELDAATDWLAVAVESKPEDHQQVFDAMRTELNRLAAEGPAISEVKTAVGQMDRAYSGQMGDTSLAEVSRQGRAFAQGQPYVSYPEFRADLAKLTPTAVSLPLLQALPTALWVFPQDSPVQAELPTVSPWSRQVAGGETADSLPSELHIAPDKLLLHYDDFDGAVSVAHSDIVGALVYIDGKVALHTRAGLVVQLAPSAFGAEDAVRQFLSKLPPELVVSTREKLVFEDVVAEVEVEEVQEVVESPTEEPLAEPSEIEDSPVDAGLEVEEEPVQPSQKADGRSRTKRERRKKSSRSGSEESVGEGGLKVPDESVTYCYPLATQFAEVIVAGAWPMAERLFESAASDEEKAHLVSVASATGGKPERFDSWVDGSANPGVALTIRGATGVRRAWDARLAAPGDSSRSAAVAFWSGLESADADLLRATVALPDSSVPWVSLLESARGLERPRHEVEQRYINHVERGAFLAGHLEFQQFVTKKWFGSHSEMWEHAEFVCQSAPDGSPELAIAPMAFIEQWLDECQSGASHAENSSWMLNQSGRQSFLEHAVDSSLMSDSFDLLTVGAAKALETFFAYYWSLADFGSAAALVPAMGRRYSGNPMGYFTKDPWSLVRAAAIRAADSQ